jgi:hypothetical protein
MNIEHIFTHHKPFGTQPVRYIGIRQQARALAQIIVDNCPDSRERSIALTNIQQAVMWANASIAINEEDISGK